MTKPLVYCSGPLFCPEEIAGMGAIARVLEDAGYGTFLPHRDGLEYYLMRHANSPLSGLPFAQSASSRAVFALDVYQIVERCDHFVFNMNGRVPDEGGVAETAIAYAAGKPVIIYKNDARSLFNGIDNSMLTCLAHAPIVDDVNDIPAAIERLAAKTPAFDYGKNAPPAMQKTVTLGRSIWSAMERFGLGGKDVFNEDRLVEEIASLCSKWER